MKTLFLVQQAVDINEKIKNAPDNAYKIGVFIGSLLPFLVFAAIAYFMYYRWKNKNEDRD